MPNFKNTVKNAVASIGNAVPAMNPKDEAVRRLGVAAELESIGRKDKDKAKKELKGLGLLKDAYLRGTSETLYESERFTLVAETNAESAMVLKEECLRAELTRRGFSKKVIADIISAAHGSNKPATKLVVTQK